MRCKKGQTRVNQVWHELLSCRLRTLLFLELAPASLACRCPCKQFFALGCLRRGQLSLLVCGCENPIKIIIMDIKSLRHALVVAETGSFVRAADKLALTQSGVSRSIHALESELGVALFERVHSGVELTPAGAAFVDKARQLVADAESLRVTVHQAQDLICGHLAFGVVPSLSIVHMSPLIAEVLGQESSLSLSLKIRETIELQDLLRKNEIEFFIAIDDRDSLDPDLQRENIGHVLGGGLFVRPGHPLLSLPAVTVADINRYPLVIGGEDRSIGNIKQDLLNSQPVAPANIQFVCDNVFVLQQVTARSEAVLVSSQSCVSDFLDHGLLVQVAVSDQVGQPQGADIVVIHLRGRILSPAAQHVINCFVSGLNTTEQSVAGRGSPSMIWKNEQLVTSC